MSIENIGLNNYVNALHTADTEEGKRKAAERMEEIINELPKALIEENRDTITGLQKEISQVKRNVNTQTFANQKNMQTVNILSNTYIQSGSPDIIMAIEAIKEIWKLFKSMDIFGNAEEKRKLFNENVAVTLEKKDFGNQEEVNKVLKALSKCQYRDMMKKISATEYQKINEKDQGILEIGKSLDLNNEQTKILANIFKLIVLNKDYINKEVSIDDSTEFFEVLQVLFSSKGKYKHGVLKLDAKDGSVEQANSEDDDNTWEKSSYNFNTEKYGKGNKLSTKEALGIFGPTKDKIERWQETVSFLGVNLKVHKYMAEDLKLAESQIIEYVKANPNDPYVKRDGGVYKLKQSNCGGFNYRGIYNGHGGYYDVMQRPSNHAAGFAIDFNDDDNPYIGSLGGGTDPFKYSTLPKYFVDIMKQNGFSWGGDWKQPYDGMHFEYTFRDRIKSKAQKDGLMIS